MSHPAPPLDASLFGGRYRPGALLGVGGSASVYRADDLDPAATDSQVALKVLHPHLCATESSRRAFLAEAGRLGTLRHPNIAAVRDFGLHDAGEVLMPWIALDLASGPTLAEHVAAAGPLSGAESVAVLTGVLDGLAAAHAVGLAHRDVSPGNVVLHGLGWLTHQVRPELVRLIDFGLADVAGRSTLGSDLLLSGEASQVRTVVGNLAYLSPEQASGQPVNAAGDLYQAGAVLYFALTGAPPFPRSSVEAVLRAHLSAPPPVPSALQPAARRLDKVVTTAMAKRTEDRFADAAAFREALLSAWARPEGGLAEAATGPAYPTTRLIDAGGAGSATQPPLTRLNATGRRAALDYLSPTDPGPAAVSRPTQASGVADEPGGSAAGIAVAAIAGVAVLAVLSAFTATGTAARPATSAATSAAAAPTSAPPSALPTATAVVPVQVPALSGSLAEAEASLNAAGLAVGVITKIPSAQSAGTVLGQTPQAGRSVTPGAKVDLRIASGSNIVPTVDGLTVAEARAALSAAGFTGSSPAGYPEEAVVSGSRPAADVLFHLGGTVFLTVANPTPIASEPGPTPSISSPP
ncbi:PASTA domain-containing protein [Propionicimonas sp.]|uniref:serine/threonine protein kinase n=1 Tax=Propionicimonas sp. TaxID=1955623 RepID=UPI0017CD1C6A|nr:PASTA domain-containing protein [Propionicimonas sp.]MBU3975463.1 serine/threonine protein kinase [Actinomycetota bacterium]MBA3020131.1 PASTA domain-containing protein [Propionicimonas sp.]MBU3986388.1 serine/threonine protein kinase [Actinomycetota bacterium]MBU4007957.1 serine/threonine protein kinase [Actinomycetota bacterium]MBU4064215.1 serine/threonine protein kinase [Actinomycetota bacterium]